VTVCGGTTKIVKNNPFLRCLIECHQYKLEPFEIEKPDNLKCILRERKREETIQKMALNQPEIERER